jgi:Anti-sigma-K factor rskA/Putative zinc-finger
VTAHGPLQLIPLHALDALPESERVEVDAHLDSCPDCMEDLGQYLVAMASLTADQAAPSHLWERLAASIEADSVPSDRQVEMIAHRSIGRSRRWRAVSRHLPIAAAAVMLVIVAGGAFSSDRDPDDAIVAMARRAAAQPEAYVGELLDNGVSVAEVILTDAGEGYFIPTGQLASLDRSRTYQLWVITPESVISGGVLGDELRPSAFTWDGPVSGFALSREVTGGVTTSAGDVVAVAADG